MSAALFSCAVNILMLTGPLFMLQVYDRVLASGSVPTLVALFSLVAGLYLFLGLFDFVRSRVLSRAGYRLDMDLMDLAKKVWITSGVIAPRLRARPINDLSSIRQFLCSNGLPALFDLPWVPVYLAVVYLLHVWLGLLATAAAIVVVTATVVSELVTKRPIAEAMNWELRDAQFAEASYRGSEAVIAMGMMGKVTQHWKGLRHQALSNAQLAGGRSESITAFTKATRMLAQSGILALGAYLAILQEMTPGGMIAASIIAGRALAPIDLAVGNWKNFIRARESYARLNALLGDGGSGEEPVQLPEPKGKLKVENVFKFVDDPAAGPNGRAVLQGIHFALEPGDALGVIGPSASGKTCLARLLLGIWLPDRGSVRLDGATYDQWDRDQLGRHLGYLPQTVELMSGTIRQYISRFDDDVSDEELVAAAAIAGVHELILKLPDGYNTQIGDGGYVLSGGQAQRIALARAVLRQPALVVLDEPNANLDSDGDAALTAAISALREAGSCVVVMAHRPSAIAAVNKVLMLKAGQQVDIGPKDEMLAKLTRPAPRVVQKVEA